MKNILFFCAPSHDSSVRNLVCTSSGGVPTIVGQWLKVVLKRGSLNNAISLMSFCRTMEGVPFMERSSKIASRRCPTTTGSPITTRRFAMLVLLYSSQSADDNDTRTIYNFICHVKTKLRAIWSCIQYYRICMGVAAFSMYIISSM